MSQEIENAVTELLVQVGVTYSAVNRGVSKNALGGTHAMDKWSCEFTSSKRQNEPEEFDFYTGFGHRAPATKDQKLRAEYEFQGLTKKDKQGATMYGRRYLARVEEMRKPVAPHAASVLHSLILDSSAVGQSFESWCADFGYDSDSRKAYATYEECQRNADKLARIFDHATREKLGELLQDY